MGIVKALEGMVSTTELAEDSPISVRICAIRPRSKAGPAGAYWINTATLAGRHNLARALLQGEEPYGDKLNPWAVAQKHGRATPESAARFLVELFLQDDIEPDVRDALLQDVRDAAASAATTARRVVLREFCACRDDSAGVSSGLATGANTMPYTSRFPASDAGRLGIDVPRACRPGVSSARLASQSSDRDTVLVAIQLTGGNDGLNTVVPYAR